MSPALNAEDVRPLRHPHEAIGGAQIGMTVSAVSPEI